MGASHVRRPIARWRYVVELWAGGRWREAGDVEAADAAAAVAEAAGEPGTYRARPEGGPPGSARLFRVQLSGRPVPIERL